MIVSDERVARFAERVLGHAIIPPFTCMGIEKNGEISAAIIFNVYEGAAVNVSAAGSGWTRELLRAAGRYVYGQLGCSRVTFITESRDVAALAMRLGGTIEGVMRDQFGPGRNGILIGILKKEWRI